MHSNSTPVVYAAQDTHVSSDIGPGNQTEALCFVFFFLHRPVFLFVSYLVSSTDGADRPPSTAAGFLTRSDELVFQTVCAAS